MRKILLAAISIIVSCILIGSSVTSIAFESEIKRESDAERESNIDRESEKVIKEEPISSSISSPTEETKNAEIVEAESKVIDSSLTATKSESDQITKTEETETVLISSSTELIGNIELESKIIKEQPVSRSTGEPPVCPSCVDTMTDIADHATNYVLVEMADWDGNWYPGLIAEAIGYFISGTIEGHDIYGPVVEFSLINVTSYIIFYVTDFISNPNNLLGDAVATIWGIGIGIAVYLSTLCYPNENQGENPQIIPTTVTTVELLSTQTKSGSMSL